MSDAEKGLREFIVARTNTPGMRDTMLDALSAALAAARAEGYARARDQAAMIASAEPDFYVGGRISRAIRAMKDETP